MLRNVLAGTAKRMLLRRFPLSWRRAFIFALLMAVVGVAAAIGAAALGTEGKILWSPSGDIWVSKPDGSGLTRLTCFGTAASPAFSARRATWSSDGGKIAFEKWPVGSADPAVYVMSGDGSDPHYVAQGMEPALSPDGTQVAFVSYPYVYIANSDGTDLHPLAYGPWPDSPSWSPEGAKIAFTDTYDRIWIYNASGGAVSVIPKPGAGIPILRSRWSPDGSKIAVVYADDNIQEHREIWTVNADGSGSTRITTNGMQDEYPGWTPAGRLFWMNASNNAVVANVDGSNQQSLPIPPAGVNGLEFFDWGSRAQDASEADCTTNGPDAPTGVNAVAGDRSAAVSWTPSTSGGESAVSSYTVTATPSGKSVRVGSSATTATVSGLSNGTTYRFTVTATNGNGGQATSGSSNAVTPTGFVTHSGTQLLINGQPYRPIGLNIYNANSNGWCWYQMNGSILDDSLSAIGSDKNSMRAWFFQQLAATNGARDWTSFDHTLAAARAHGYRVIATLIDQWGNCGATNGQGYGYKTPAWYQDGYKQGDPSAIVSYRDWVQEVVSRYKDDPTILAWQLVNEPEVSVPASGGGGCDETAAEPILDAFASDVAGLIKSIDPNHLVSLGTIGTGQCGAQSTDYKAIMSDPSLDLCEYHDYGDPNPIPGDQWNGLQVRINQCNELGKPLVVGELGVKPSDVGGAFADRANVVASKLCGQLSAGVAGVLLWAWDKDGSILDNFDIGPGDPVLDVLGRWSDPSHTCSPPSAPSRVAAAAGDGSASVSWTPPDSDGGSPIMSYTVTASPGGASTTTQNGSTMTAIVSGLANGTAYTFSITATNAAGRSTPSDASTSVVPRQGNVAATGVASPSSTTSVVTSTDPATSGGLASAVTVPAGTAGGLVTVTQTTTTEPAASGYLFGGVQVDVTAPAGTAANPLKLAFTLAPPAGQTAESIEIYRAEGAGLPVLIPNCNDSSGQAAPDPCVASRVPVSATPYVAVSVLTSSTSHWNTATPKPGAVTVSNSGYSPQNVSVQPGAYVNWAFGSTKNHSVTDSTGLGNSSAPWFDSGAKSSGSFRFTLPYAGAFPYRSTVKGDSMTGTVLVPVVVTPPSGHSTTSFSVIWSTRTLLQSGYVADIQYRFRPARSTGWKSWTDWKTGVTTAGATFAPAQGIGTYAFHARLRNKGSGRASAYSPDVTFSVS